MWEEDESRSAVSCVIMEDLNKSENESNWKSSGEEVTWSYNTYFRNLKKEWGMTT